MAPRQDIRKKISWQNHDQTLICLSCEETFQRKPGRGRLPKFCSIRCKEDLRAESRRKYKKFTKVCERCEQPFETNNAGQKCCSHKCGAGRAGRIRYKLNRVGIPQDHKRCGYCKGVKPFAEFSLSSSTDDGYDSRCRECRKSNFAHYISQPGKLEAKLSKQRAKGRTREEKDIKNEFQNIIRNHRLKTDPRYKLSEGMRRSIGTSLRKRGGSKRGYHWEDLVDYTLDDLKRHLEKQFELGMSWKNYGKWHIDHKIPIDAFNFTRPEHIDFKRCWALSNLKPLWAPENLSKGARLDKPFQPALAIG